MREAIKSKAITIVKLNANFSNPRLLLNVIPLSLPEPKAPPIPESDF